MTKLKSAVELERLRDEILSQRTREKPTISICGGTGCHAYKCEDVANAFQKEIKRQGLADQVELKVTGCHGFCERGPLMVLYPEKIFYQRISPSDVPEILAETVVKGNVIERLLYVDPVDGKSVQLQEDVAFYRQQQRLKRLRPENVRSLRPDVRSAAANPRILTTQ